MDRLRVFIVGDSLFAEGIARTLMSCEAVIVIDIAATVESALPALEAKKLDAIIVAGPDTISTTNIGPFLAAHPNLTIIRADLSSDKVQIITSRCIQARTADLLAAMNSILKSG